MRFWMELSFGDGAVQAGLTLHEMSRARSRETNRRAIRRSSFATSVSVPEPPASIAVGANALMSEGKTGEWDGAHRSMARGASVEV